MASSSEPGLLYTLGPRWRRNRGSLTPPPSQPVEDRAPDSLASGMDQTLRRELEQLLGDDRVLHRVSDLVAYASDASPYRLFPRAVVEARGADDVAKVLRFGR